MAFAPYQITPDQAHRERKKAALLRALAGVAARGGGDFLSSFQTGLGGALQMGELQREQSRRDEELALRRLAAQPDERPESSRYGPMPFYEDPNSPIPQDVRLQYRQDALYHPERQPARQYGPLPYWMNPEVPEDIRAKAQADAFYHPAQNEPQGEQDIAAISATYGVGPDTARVMKISGATRIRPRSYTTTAPNPYTHQMETRTTTVNEPVQLWTWAQTQNTINGETDLNKLDAIAGGDIPDEIPDDPQLHQNVRALAARRAFLLRQQVARQRN